MCRCECVHCYLCVNKTRQPEVPLTSEVRIRNCLVLLQTFKFKVSTEDKFIFDKINYKDSALKYKTCFDLLLTRLCTDNT